MTDQQRIAVNIVAQYTRTLVTVCLTLYSTRILLSALGQSDFGIYSVVAGVVTMLAFITNALVTTTQRYLSYYKGQKDPSKLETVFCNSLWLHIAISILLSGFLWATEGPIMAHMLHIPAERMVAATAVYRASVVTLLLTFITAPFRADFVARENIVYISVVDILDGVMRLGIALLLATLVRLDRLTTYGWLLAGIAVFNLLAIGGYALWQYPETRALSPKGVRRNEIASIGRFLGWSVWSAGCIMVRTQGLAVVINRAIGTIANAAYGIGQQVLYAVLFLSQSVINAMNPQLMRAEGQGERSRMLRIAMSECKIAYMVLLLAGIPLTLEMPTVLQYWLGEVPEGSVLICRIMIISGMIDQLSLGLNSANQATGNIRSYSLLVNTTKLLTLPAAIWAVHRGYGIVGVMTCYLLIESLCMLLRIPHLVYTAELSFSEYLRRVLLPVSLPTLLVTGAGMTFMQWTDSPYRVFGTIALCGIVWLICVPTLAMNREERDTVKKLIRR